MSKLTSFSPPSRFYWWLCQYLLFILISSTAYITRFNLTTHIHSNQSSNSSQISKEYSIFSSQAVNIYSEYILVCFVIYYLWIIIKRLTPSFEMKTSWLRALVQAPEMSMFSFTCLLILSCIPLRFLDWYKAEDFLVSIVMFTLPLKLLFFCRASRSVGSFVVMIYKILVNDVLCFVVFMVIFVAGFSQCKYHSMNTYWHGYILWIINRFCIPQLF